MRSNEGTDGSSGDRAEDGSPTGSTTILDKPLLWPQAASGTGFVFAPDGNHLPVVQWVGPLESIMCALRDTSDPNGDVAQVVAMLKGVGGAPLLTEHSRGYFTRPALRGHRLSEDRTEPIGGRDWSTQFLVRSMTVESNCLTIEAADVVAGLSLCTLLESVEGGAVRARHILRNDGSAPYVVEGLEVLFPIADHFVEALDFTGRHARERVPQRRSLEDGLWLRESRRGKTGVDSYTMLVVGTAGFDTVSGEVLALHVGWSGNSVVRLERDHATTATIGGGELLLPGEIVLSAGEEYTTPWVWAVASTEGLDDVAFAFHQWLRSQESHPDTQPVTLNVWEAVYFDHDSGRLSRLAELAAGVGVERYVLDDGWFRHRRHDRAGLGDWWVDTDIWPQGLDPLIDRVHVLGMEFGLWFEPEMVNPDSDLFRAHPEWVFCAGERLPLLQRNQLVLDIGRDDVFQYLLERVDAILSRYRIDYVKWDHNRDLLEAGSSERSGAPGIHRQTQAFYRLLDELRRRHPTVAWESCAGGGGRIDLGVLSRVERVWTSDMTDALARQSIQRWTSQLVAPEYLGAHVSAPTSHQSGRSFTLDFRAAIAFFGAFGIEWDITTASEEDLGRLRQWVQLFKRFRPLLHDSRSVRPQPSDRSVQAHGVISHDRSEALLALVQLDWPDNTRGATVRIPGLDPGRLYNLHQVTPGEADRHVWSGETGGVAVPGRLLATVGYRFQYQQPQSATLVHISAVN